MPSGQQIALWRKVDPDFDKYYDATPYGDKGLFLSIYKEVFKWFYKPGRPPRRLVITESLPEKFREKYLLKPGDEFESLTDLEKFCNCSTTKHWPKYGWTKYIDNEKPDKHWIEKQ